LNCWPLQVAEPSGLVVGQLYDTWWTDIGNTFNKHM